MNCPRLDHFVRFNSNGTVSRCGHMVNPMQFESLIAMDDSIWLHNIKSTMSKGLWPKECIRCKETENNDNTSIRLNSIEFDNKQTIPDYITVGGVLDNICNSGCLSCNENHSTKIGSLKFKLYPMIDNTKRFWQLPIERIVHLDINGGEPSASKNYKSILQNLPVNVKSVRINTNCSSVIEEIYSLIDRGIKITITVSLDGIEDVHDFVRWPIKWDKFYQNLMQYKSIPNIELNTWTTISSLNLHNFEAIKQFTIDNNIEHSYAFLHSPEVISVKYQNNLTLPYKNMFPDVVAIAENNQTLLDNFIINEKKLRGIIE